ncbi:MAG: peptidase domain-containing ABC transporter [Eubacterium sp.]|nr:peptidase domain-containing ABC transporter [Eubacterium sp.]
MYYCIKQHDITDCAAACLATVSKQYGLNLPISKIREYAGTDKQGTNVYGVIKAAEKLGFSAKGVKGTPDAFFSNFPLPAIAHVVTREGLLHYVVIHKIKKNKVIIADPAKGIIKCSPEDFFKFWTGVLIILVPTTQFEKGNKNQSVILRFIKLLAPQKRLLLNVFLCSLLISILGILASFYFRIIMDTIVPNSLRTTLKTVSIGVIFLYIFKYILEFFRYHLMTYLGQKLDIPLILGFFGHTLGLPMSFFGTRKTGEVVSRFADASKIRAIISSASLTIMVDTIMAVAGAIVLFSQNRLLFAISVLIALIYAALVFAFNGPVKRVNEEQMEDNAQVTSYLVEGLSGIETVKSYNAEIFVKNRMDSLFVKLMRSVFKGAVITNLQKTITDFLYIIGETVIIWVGVTEVLNGKMTIGSLITFNVLLAYFLEPVKNLLNLQPQMQTAIVAAERLSDILDVELEKTDMESKKIIPESLDAPITIKDVTFRYGTRRPVLEDINIRIERGEKIAIVGESGSGKTTLAKLLLNFYELEKGDIFIGDYNIKDINIDVLREKMAYISQDIFLFSGTIRENIEIADQDATLDEIIDVCKMCKVDDFINELPLRYETKIEENGTNLSGGQKQRLALARALIKKPDILIMDEATSNLDTITEKAISQTIENVSGGTTSVIIAHRLSTIMNCDKIIVLSHGKVVEQGRHQELMNQKGEYYKLWQGQIIEQES